MSWLDRLLRRQQQPRPTPHGVAPSLANRRGAQGTSSTSREGRARRNRCVFAVATSLVLVGYVHFILDYGELNGFVAAGGGGGGRATTAGQGVDASGRGAAGEDSSVGSGAGRAAPGADVRHQELRSEAEPARGGEKQEGGNNNDGGDAAFDRCSFRSYPSHRYYGINAPLESHPTFLSEAKYIRGKPPVALNPPGRDARAHARGGNSIPRKVCVDTSGWEDVKPGRYPFSDGQNPSVVSLASDPYGKSEGGAAPEAERRLDAASIAPLAELYGGGATELDRMYLGVLVVGNAQCGWRMAPEELAEYRYSDLDAAPDRRTIITILDEGMGTVGQTTLLLEHDAPWGKNRRKGEAIPSKDGGGGFERSVQYFDDPRIFFHDGEPYVLYRNGGRFGYEDQVQNPLRFEKTKEGENGEAAFVAYVKASETFTVCCGRNIALVSEGKGTSALKALTWVDPVTVVDVDMGNLKALSRAGGVNKGRRLLENDGQFAVASSKSPLVADQAQDMPRRRLARRRQQPKSEIHGTNGYMVPLRSTSELLGIAHFHRPENRAPSDYALHGHHYTHALFTIAKRTDGGNDDKGGYQLKRISNEFVFRSMSPSLSKAVPPVVDAETIQFASGLDLVGSDKDGRLLLSYGVNDCEGGVVFIDMEAVQSLLLDVPDGKEVVDLMATAKP